MSKARPSWPADLALAGNTLVWGATFVVVKDALKYATPFAFLAIRFSLAAAALFLIFLGRWREPNRARGFRAGLFAGVFLFAGYALQTVGLRLTTPSKSAFITGLTVVMVPLIGSAVYRSRPRLVELAGVAVACVGMGLLTLEGASWRIGRGDLLTLGCAAAFAAHILVLGHYSLRVSFEALSLTQIAAVAALSLGMLGWMEKPTVIWTPALAGAILVTGLLATAVAFTVQSWAQRRTSPTRTGLIFSLEPVFAWATSFLLTGEVLSARAALGAGLILAGILLVELKPFSPPEHLSQ